MSESFVYRLDRELRFTFVSARMAQFLGQPVAAVLGRGLFDVYPAARGTLTETRLREALATGEEQHFETPSVSVPGHLWELHAYPTSDGVTVTYADRRATEGADDAERRLGQMLSVIRDPLCVIDRELRFLSVNPAAEAYMGLPAAAILGHRMADLFPQLAGSPLEAQLRRAIEASQEGHFDIESRLRPGTWYEVHLYPSHGGLLLYYRDITARRRDALALATSERLLRVAQSMAHVGSFVVEEPADLATARVTWSDETFRIFGLEPGAIQPTVDSFFTFVHRDDRAALMDAVRNALEHGAPYEVEHRIEGADGRKGILHQWGVVERDASGVPRRVLGACQDVTAERQREAQAREAQQQLQFVTDTMAAHVARISRDERYLWVSRGYATARGFTPEQVVGRTVTEVLGERVSAAIRPQIERVLQGQRVTYEARVDYPGRGPTWIEAHYEPTFGPDGSADGWVALVVDVDERRRAEESLREADRRKDEFLAMLAHELRNPLAPIRNSVHVLKLLGPQEPRLVAVRDMIDRQVSHMARLLDDLLDVSRITRGKVLLRKEAVDLRRLVQSTSDDLRALLERNRLELTVGVPPTAVPVIGDPTRLSQIVGNLVQNANKFTNPGGHVSVRLDSEGDAAVLTVTDDGIGMDEGILGRVFEPFAQADRSLDRAGGGLGLGLALVRGLAELHGGTASAASAGLGRGATFTVRIPLAADVAAPEEEATSVGAVRGRRVLVIEDNRDAAESLRLLLEVIGHEVEVVHGGRDGVEAATARPPEIVLCDIGLAGGMDGYEVARTLRGTAGAALHLVALSGYGQDEDKARATAAGFEQHLTKPVDPLRLQRLLDELS